MLDKWLTFLLLISLVLYNSWIQDLGLFLFLRFFFWLFGCLTMGFGSGTGVFDWMARVLRVMSEVVDKYDESMLIQ